MYSNIDSSWYSMIYLAYKISCPKEIQFRPLSQGRRWWLKLFISRTMVMQVIPRWRRGYKMNIFQSIWLSKDCSQFTNPPTEFPIHRHETIQITRIWIDHVFQNIKSDGADNQYNRYHNPERNIVHTTCNNFVEKGHYVGISYWSSQVQLRKDAKVHREYQKYSRLNNNSTNEAGGAKDVVNLEVVNNRWWW